MVSNNIVRLTVSVIKFRNLQIETPTSRHWNVIFTVKKLSGISNTKNDTSRL